MKGVKNKKKQRKQNKTIKKHTLLCFVWVGARRFSSRQATKKQGKYKDISIKAHFAKVNKADCSSCGSKTSTQGDEEERKQLRCKAIAITDDASRPIATTSRSHGEQSDDHVNHRLPSPHRPGNKEFKFELCYQISSHRFSQPESQNWSAEPETSGF